MDEITYKIAQIYEEHDRYVICSNTSWLGKLSLSEEEFEAIGRPTVGDTLLMSLRLSNQKVIE